MEKKGPESIVLRFVWLENLTQDYTNDEIGQIVRDLYSYAKEGAAPQQYEDRGMRGLWRSMKDGIDKDFAKYREKSAKAAASANARWGKTTQASAESEMQSNANASEKMQTHLVECDIVHSHHTNTNISTNTATATTAHHSIASDGKNSNCHFANSKNALSVSESESVAVVDTTAAPRTDSDLAEIVQHFQQVIGDFPRSALDKLRRYQETFPTEVICMAFDEAAENGVRKWRYVDGILKGWQADGVRTLGDVEARRESRMKPDQQPERKLEMLT